MLTDVQVINLGLSKIAASRITSIAPPGTSLEKYMAVNYKEWKRYELTRRRWVFATEDNYLLTLNDTVDGTAKPYSFLLPVDCLRPIRDKCTEWVQRGRKLWSSYNTLRISYIRNAPEEEFDPLFNEVLACKIAMESAEYVTQSNSKRQLAESMYDRAVKDASEANAFVVGPEDVQSDDSAFSWLSDRYG